MQYYKSHKIHCDALFAIINDFDNLFFVQGNQGRFSITPGLKLRKATARYLKIIEMINYFTINLLYSCLKKERKQMHMKRKC